MDHTYTNVFEESEQYDQENEKVVIKNEDEKDSDELLIDLIRSYKCIWDKQDKLHRNSDAIAGAWAEIARSMHTTVNYVMGRWQALRKHFSKERQNREKDALNDSAASFRKPWHLYEHLLFLGGNVQRRRSRMNLGLVLPQQTKRKTSDNCNNSTSSTSELSVTSNLRSSETLSMSRILLSTLQPSNENVQSSPFIETSTSRSSRLSVSPQHIGNNNPSTSNNTQSSPGESLSPPRSNECSSIASLPRPPRNLSNSSADSADIEYVQPLAQSFNQSPIFKNIERKRRQTSTQNVGVVDEEIVKTINQIRSALSDYTKEDGTQLVPARLLQDSDFLVGHIIGNKLRLLSEPKKTKLTIELLQVIKSFK